MPSVLFALALLIGGAVPPRARHPARVVPLAAIAEDDDPPDTAQSRPDPEDPPDPPDPSDQATPVDRSESDQAPKTTMRVPRAEDEEDDDEDEEEESAPDPSPDDDDKP